MDDLTALGSIPACAGKPNDTGFAVFGSKSRVYPRVCGEASG